MGHFFWPVTCAHTGQQLNADPLHPVELGVSPPPPGDIER